MKRWLHDMIGDSPNEPPLYQVHTTDAAFQQAVDALHKQYPDINRESVQTAFEHYFVDVCGRMLADPEWFVVNVTDEVFHNRLIDLEA